MRRTTFTTAWPVTFGIGALLCAVGCNRPSDLAVRAQSFDTQRAQTVGYGEYTGAPAPRDTATSNGPVLVSCEADQRALIRSVVVNGQSASQVECVTTGAPAVPAVYPGNGMVQYPANAMVQYAPASYPARVVPAVTYAPERRVVTERPVYRQTSRRSVPQGRSVKKSAIIIGSSAGVGAGVGAAVGGKKGALIGAAIGGGSAAIWDQITRRKQ